MRFGVLDVGVEENVPLRSADDAIVCCSISRFITS
jgi:hypothetical protein